MRPQLASAAWSGHPSTELWWGLTQIGLAARNRKPASPVALALIRDASVKAPLAPEPFLVRGVEAQVGQNPRVAAQAFRAALMRDSRSIPARYFMSEEYFRSGDVLRGLKEIAILARMVPNGVDSLGPYVATYAKNSRTRKQMLDLFRSNPQIEQATLTALSADPANADLVLGLATPTAKPPQWAARLVESLVGAGQYGKAHAIWANLSHVAPTADLIFDPRFERPQVQPPFNWSLTSSALGLAEGQQGGRLHVIYYGQDNGPLAKQLLILGPGRYRLAMRISGDLAHARSLVWMIACAGSGNVLLSLPLSAAVPAGTFDVPASCTAQNLALVGNAPELPQQVDVTISELSLTRGQSNG